MTNPNIPCSLAQDVVDQISVQAQEQGITVNELLRKAYDTQVGAMATRFASESDLESPE